MSQNLRPNRSEFRLPNTEARARDGWHFSIDRGGTFTDVVGIDPLGALHTCKVLSHDPHRPADPALRGIGQLLDRHGAQSGRRVLSVRLGTTVATNALLERAGAPTLLVTSQGMRDALLIGYQERPDIFARAIVRPAPLYTRVVEIPERITAEGQVLVPLDETALRTALAAARGDGIESIAIAFLHAFRYPAHEALAAAIARDAGFDEVIASHAAAPMLGFVARGDTTVADAYLSPVLLRYTAEFRRSLHEAHGDVAVAFMQSNGGLVDAEGFRGVNGVLSGPAGGVVGMIAAGDSAGAQRLIGFDMGGTSTDVSLSSGEIPRRFSAEIDGVRLQTPLVDITTIAAGGGSVLRCADGRLQVGPASAGADPGPACYRRGGPATITDCNVVLGRIPPAHFPQVFGASGTDPIDPAAARARLAELAAAARAEAGLDYTAETLAAAFLEVACARMANAIRELTLQHGEDPARFGLLCFGGAAGQHACAVADLLGVPEVFLHPLAGVLSAYGIGLTSRRVVRRRTVECALDAAGHAAGERALALLRDDAIEELRRQRVPLPRIERARARPRASRWLRLDDRIVLAIRLGPARSLFRSPPPAVRLRRRDRIPRDRGGDGRSHRASRACSGTQAELPARSTTLASTPTTPVWIDGTARDVVVLNRSDLRQGDTLTGPLLLCEDGATSWIAPGWSGEVRAGGMLVLRRAALAQRPAQQGRLGAARPDATRGVQRAVHACRGADGRRAAPDRELGQHQGTARFFVCDLRCRREPGSQRPAHARAPGVDGRERVCRARGTRRAFCDRATPTS